jgi:hypothetical protein
MPKNLQIAIFAAVFYISGILTAILYNDNDSTYANLQTLKPASNRTISQVHYDFPLPNSFNLCGEPMPLEDRRVWEMLDREFTITVWDQAQVLMYLKRASRYFPYIESRLALAQMPDDLKYLAVAESALIIYSRSRKGARGPWQFMTPTARVNGLRRNLVVDERLDFELSTEAALQNLKRLKEKFGSWVLAMAAYNGGETRLRKAIKEQKTNDYYRLNLPLETERYVFRIAAIKIILANPNRYGYVLSSEGHYQPKAYDSVEVKTHAPIDIIDIADLLETDFKTLKELNPQFLRDYIPIGRYTVKVPPSQGIRMVNALKQTYSKTVNAVLIATDKKKVEVH